MNVLVIEDEPLAAQALAALLTRLRPATRILACLGSVEEAVEWLEEHPAPDVLFCDIHLSDGNSFDIFRQVAVGAPVIFTTAYDAYAIQAFQVNSVDYLLKPLQAAEVDRALQKYETLRPATLPAAVANVQRLVHTTPRARFLVKSRQAWKAVPVDDVAYFLAEEGVVFLVTHPGKRFLIADTLDQLEGQLDAQRFFRINRQFILSIGAVQEIRPYFKGRLVLQVAPPVAGEALVVSAGRAPAFKHWLDH
ncbi:LytR/AlgR family response regulator transcription factor [Hymenobacter arizonensis]|uniref:DNA-binding response regulator, LytR/AlgR family n=1 Tax=Hymenobacter arizonensis TaxID=1227077 RepID=A0A1I6BT55_HYMAR|nr:LytTR family DNA-binding domain-containing protein [Hymenobacter arizonensis]SFQ84037.1 DNA-binding response regulator, LytR/AlgR family [Hymenobacter arizonensis]